MRSALAQTLLLLSGLWLFTWLPGTRAQAQEVMVLPPSAGKMPELQGGTVKSARRQLTKLSGLRLGEFEVQSDEAPGTVLGQFPPAGTALSLGQKLQLRVSAGPSRLEKLEKPPMQASAQASNSGPNILYVLLQALALLVLVLALRQKRAPAAPTTAALARPPARPGPAVNTTPVDRARKGSATNRPPKH